jgi:hypothetical protein
MADENPTATVRMVQGQLVLDDPTALGMISAIEKHNCRRTFETQKDRVRHFTQRIVERGASPKDVVIVIINVDDAHGGPLADLLMPGSGAMWQKMREESQIPFARGLALREGIQDFLALFDKEAADSLLSLPETELAVVVVDYGVAEIFVASEAKNE